MKDIRSFTYAELSRLLEQIMGRGPCGPFTDEEIESELERRDRIEAYYLRHPQEKHA